MRTAPRRPLAVAGFVLGIVGLFVVLWWYDGVQVLMQVPSSHILGAHIIGKSNAPVILTVFTDFECPHCKRFHESTLAALQKKYPGELRIIYKNFPRSVHSGAYTKAEAAECVSHLFGDDAYWKYVSTLFARQPDESIGDTPDGYLQDVSVSGFDAMKVRACVESGYAKSIVDGDVADARILGVHVTPTVAITRAGTTILVRGDRDTSTRSAIEYELDTSMSK